MVWGFRWKCETVSVVSLVSGLVGFWWGDEVLFLFRLRPSNKKDEIWCGSAGREADLRDFPHFVFVEMGCLCVCVRVCVCVCGCVCIQKVLERFHRNKSKPANEDVAERVFLLAERRIEVTYHLEDHRFIPSKRSFIKPRESTEKKKAEDFTPDMVSGFQVQTITRPVDFTAASRITHSHYNCVCVCAQVDPSEKPPNTLILYGLLVNLMKDEDRVVHQIRGSQKEVTTSSVSPVPLHRSDIYGTSTNCQVKHFTHHTCDLTTYFLCF